MTSLCVIASEATRLRRSDPLRQRLRGESFSFVQARAIQSQNYRYLRAALDCRAAHAARNDDEEYDRTYSHTDLVKLRLRQGE